MDLINSFKFTLSRYADFSGRSRRTEYWYFVLGQMLVSIMLVLVTGLAGILSDSLGVIGMLLYFVSALFFLIPGFAVAVRRMHDVGYSGWMYLIGIIPLIGAVAILYFVCQDSQPGPNKWGPNPKEESKDLDLIDHMV